MNSAAIIHRADAAYIYPVSREALHIRLTAARGDLDEAELLYWPRGETDPAVRRHIPLIPRLRDAERDYYTATVQTDGIAAYVRYVFRLRAGDEERWLCPNGLRNTEPAMNEEFFEFLWPNPGDCYAAPGWCSSQVYYQIFPERFRNGDVRCTPVGAEPWGGPPTRSNFMGGDLAGICEKLDYIADLGATCIYLNPVFDAPSNHKYDTRDYYKIDPQFGTEDDLRKLVEQAHKRGIRVILDGVFNHCGYEWAPFQDVVENGAASQYRDWFFLDSFPVTLEKRNYDCVGHYKWMPKLNHTNPHLRHYFTEVGTYWLQRTGADGWRLDVADEVPMTFWEEFSSRVKWASPQAMLLGETWGDAARLVAPGRLDSAMNYVFRDAVRDWLALDKIDAGQFSHRANRMLALYPFEVSLRMYNLLDSHDTERFLTLCGGDEAIYRLAVALQMCFPGCPAIYYGDEIGMEGGNDPDCRRAMDWGRAENAPPLLLWFKQLTALRKKSPALLEGGFYVSLCDNAANVFGFCRTHETENVLVVICAGSAPYTGLARVPAGGFWEDVFTGTEFHTKNEPSTDPYSSLCPELLEVSLAGQSVRIFRQIRK